MPPLKPDELEVLPGANLDQGCQTPPQESQPTNDGPDSQRTDSSGEAEHPVTWDGIQSHEKPTAGIETWRTSKSQWATFLEWIALTAEKPINRFTGIPQLNPLYHTGTIATFLLIIVGITGLYLFFFFQYGFEASYEAVARMEDQFIARIVRAVHRYASGALVITTLLHAFRTLFLEQFRGPRWLAWVTGIVMTALLWLAGVTGYWLIWDQRAQLITESFTDFLDSLTSLTPAFMAQLFLAENGDKSWPILLILFAIHVILFLIVAGFFWLHIMRLNRPKWFPDLHWAVGLTIILLVGGLLFPVGMLPPANPNQLPGPVTLDPLFLFYLPTSGKTAGFWLWGGLIVATVALTAMPWLSKREKPTVNIIKDRCTGCTKCAHDCPYKAITMMERQDGKPHKYIAIEDPDLCISCGICVGSCDGVAVTLGDTPPELLWQTVESRLFIARVKAPEAPLKIIYTCDRHAVHGISRQVQESNGGSGSGPAVEDTVLTEIIALPCIGAVPPDLLTRTVDAGAAEVQIVGCPPNDCVNREGNLWTEQRLTRQRVPRLKKRYIDTPITAAYVPPNELSEAASLPVMPQRESDPGAGDQMEQPDYVASRKMKRPATWRNLIPAFTLLSFALLVQILFTDLFFHPNPSPLALVQIVLPDPGESLRHLGIERLKRDEIQLRLEMGEQVLYESTYQPGELFSHQIDPVFVELELTPGEYELKLHYVDEAMPLSRVLFRQNVGLEPGQILRLSNQHVTPDN